MKQLLGKMFLLSLFAAAFVKPTFSQNKNRSMKTDEEQILFALQNWPKISASGEKDKFLYYFTDDAIIMGPGQPTIKGKEAIWQMIEGSKNIPGFKMEWDTEPSSVNVSKGGDIAYVTLNNRLTMNDPSGTPATKTNKAVLIWRKQPDNSWKEALVIFNEDPSPSK